jgi:GNAT superfamily N-acetyltransferase
MQLRPVRYEEAAPLVEAMAGELTIRYGGEGGPSHADPADFLPPVGVFLVGSVDGIDVACGGLRPLHGFGERLGEVKRMYVAPSHRGRGLSRVVLGALLDHARAVGLARVWLETGTAQPEAMSLYESVGFAAIPPYGQYKDHPESRCFALALDP